MNPTHLRTGSPWAGVVTGHWRPPVRRPLAAPLGFCPACRHRAAEEARPGGALLASSQEAPPPGLLDGILARLKAPQAPRVGAETLPLPRQLWSLFPDLGKARWQGALTPGFRFLEVQPGLHLVHMAQGRPFPEHGHTGQELSVILAGGLKDGDKILEAGDFDEVGAEDAHAPVALPDEDCWLLASLEGEIRFRGWRGFLQRAAGK